jgi:8-amino-7-oxononanoate synthase
VLDFSSSLYLGLEHRAADLRAWAKLTLGKPALLEDPPGADAVERELAELAGCEAAVLAPSTLHAFIDLIPMLAGAGKTIFIHRGAYRMAWWGVQQAAASGAKHATFRDPDVLRDLLRKSAARPIVITDGVSIDSGEAAPAREYAREAERYGGVLVIDDTQALGIFGEHPGPKAPYGSGGGGSLRRAGLKWRGAIVVNSLAKGFGVPVAMVAGSAKMIAAFRPRSLTRMHSSPPSAAVIAAAARALEINRTRGDELRSKLARRVAHFEGGIRNAGMRSNRSLFPVRPLRLPAGVDAGALYHDLEKRGVRTVLKGRPGAAGIIFVIRASHRLSEIDAAIEILTEYTEAHGGRT